MGLARYTPYVLAATTAVTLSILLLVRRRRLAQGRADPKPPLAPQQNQEPPQQPQEPPPLVNRRVIVCGLVSKPQFNGSKGFAISFDAAKGRYNVKLDETGAVLALQPANITGVDDALVADDPPGRPVTLVFDNSADSSSAVATLLGSTLGASFHCEHVDVNTFPAEALQIGGTFVFIVEVDKEGEAPAARKMTRALRPMRLMNAGALEGTNVAVLALAHSVCAFSAASGGADKFRGGERLLSALTDAGARTVHKLGSAEVEVEEVETSVVPWAKAVRKALEKDADAEKALDNMMRSTHSQMRPH